MGRKQEAWNALMGGLLDILITYIEAYAESLSLSSRSSRMIGPCIRKI